MLQKWTVPEGATPPWVVSPLTERAIWATGEPFDGAHPSPPPLPLWACSQRDRPGELAGDRRSLAKTEHVLMTLPISRDQYHTFASECFLTFDLTSDQEQLPRNKKRRNKVKKSNRGGSLSRMDRRIDVM
ncbi:hypothetical protein EYF80_029412 [Liparis tanakae]|uniref:Uncharacterized protein n=1 Tax=Liparis tanakae TaxID=230148 RepID=A0A4Z2H5U8_9TELE|nr:hypothetical protein EYF80_029412 [Liparis tanakae]